MNQSSKWAVGKIIQVRYQVYTCTILFASQGSKCLLRRYLVPKTIHQIPPQKLLGAKYERITLEEVPPKRTNILLNNILPNNYVIRRFFSSSPKHDSPSNKSHVPLAEVIVILGIWFFYQARSGMMSRCHHYPPAIKHGNGIFPVHGVSLPIKSSIDTCIYHLVI